MQALTIQEKLIYRNIKKAAIVYLLMIRLDPTSLTESTAAEILQINRATARRYLFTLQELNIITRLGRYDGFILTGSGRQLTLPSCLSGLPKGKKSPSTSNPGNEGENRALGALLKEEDEVTIESLKTSSSDGAENRLYLERSDLLFEDRVITHGLELDQLAWMDVLGWLAEAYDTRSRLANPAGLVYRRLQSNTRARAKYRNNPGSYLPVDYLEKVGLIDLIPKCDSCRCYPCQCLPPPEPEPLERFDPTPTERVDQNWGGSFTPAKAWQAAKGQLQMEMPKSTFDTWVKDAVLIDADQDTRELTVGVQNAYCREWLESRITSSVNRLMTGIMNSSNITVTFVVVQPDQSE